MSECSVRIERLTNGYEVTIKDPKIVELNNKRDNAKSGYAPWKDPNREYVFKTIAEVIAFLTKNLDKALPADQYDSAFDLAVEAAETED